MSKIVVRPDQGYRFLATVLFICALAILVAWLGISYEDRQFEEGSAKSTGVIFRMGFKYIRVAYWVDGERYVGVRGISESERRRYGNVEIGDSVEVEYVLKNPGLARVHFEDSWRRLKYGE